MTPVFERVLEVTANHDKFWELVVANLQHGLADCHEYGCKQCIEIVQLQNALKPAAGVEPYKFHGAKQELEDHFAAMSEDDRACALKFLRDQQTKEKDAAAVQESEAS